MMKRMLGFVSLAETKPAIMRKTKIQRCMSCGLWLFRRAMGRNLRLEIAKAMPVEALV